MPTRQEVVSHTLKVLFNVIAIRPSDGLYRIRCLHCKETHFLAQEDLEQFSHQVWCPALDLLDFVWLKLREQAEPVAKVPPSKGEQNVC